VKLIIQIPCHNEAETLPLVFADLPDEIPGVERIETLVIDDGSSDDTAAVARRLGADHVLELPINVGLAQAFQRGLDTCLHLGADVIVNTDGDNQYPSAAIPALVTPVVNQQADIVIGDRQVQNVPHFSPVKKRFQAVGSWVVRTLSGAPVPDTVSGFRAYSREAALRLNVLTRFSYTLETIIQAGKLGLAIHSVPVTPNAPTRPSRLQRNMWQFIKAQAGTIIRVYAFYEPLRTFFYLAAPFFLTGTILLGRFGYFYLTNQSGIGRYVQSVAIGTGFFLLGVLIALFGIQADIAAKHRQLTEETLYRLKKLELERSSDR
jgi:glycosyltransferase involved in cell wall biosynthesis